MTAAKATPAKAVPQSQTASGHPKVEVAALKQVP
jgi:hypothetical protein